MQLATEIEAAISNPTDANLRKLLHKFDQEIAQYSHDIQLKVAGQIFVQFAELIELRANQLLDLWEEHHNPCFEEPILTSDMLQEVLRQTMVLNLEDLLETPDRKERSPTDSVIGEVEKEDLLHFLDQLDQQEAKQQAIAIAHDENVSLWGRMIHTWMMDHSKSISLVKLQEYLHMPFSEIWLGILLGGFVLEQKGEFYNAQTILVSID